MIQLKNALKRQWRRCNSLPAKQQMRTELNKMQKLIDKMVKFALNTRWSNELKNISKGGKKIWNLAKHFRGKTDTNVNKIKINGSSTIGDSDRANSLAKFFEASHSITADYNHENDRIVRNTIRNFNSFAYMNCQAPVIEIAEVQNILKTLRPYKSPGPDIIHNVLLKKLPISAIEWLTHTLNNCIKFSYWPASFKIAKVIPILKAGKSPTQWNNFWCK